MQQPDLIVTVHGVELALDDRGPGPGARADALPLVLLHGFTGGRVDFADVIDDLATHRRVLAWDHRGHADSTNTGDPPDYTFDQLAADAAGLLGQLGVDAFHLLGHSMGGIVAQRYALAHPDQVRSLILMDTAGEALQGLPPELLEATVTRGRTDGMAAVADTMRQMASAMPMPEATRETLLARLVHKLTHMDVEAFDALGKELGAFPSMLDRLGSELAVPVTVLVGANDPLRPAADVLHRAITGSELAVIPDAGHSPQDDQPTAWLAAVRAHLARADIVRETIDGRQTMA